MISDHLCLKSIDTFRVRQLETFTVDLTVRSWPILLKKSTLPAALFPQPISVFMCTAENCWVFVYPLSFFWPSAVVLSPFWCYAGTALGFGDALPSHIAMRLRF